MGLVSFSVYYPFKYDNFMMVRTFNKLGQYTVR